MTDEKIGSLRGAQIGKDGVQVILTQLAGSTAGRREGGERRI